MSVLRFTKFALIFPNFTKIFALNLDPKFGDLNVVFDSPHFFILLKKPHYLSPFTWGGCIQSKNSFSDS